MKAPVLSIGVVGGIASLTLNEYAALCVAGVTIATMLPLLFWRWRALLQGKKKDDSK